MCGRDHDYALDLYKFADRVFFLTGKLVEPRQYYLYIYIVFEKKVDGSTTLMSLAAKTTISEHIVI